MLTCVVTAPRYTFQAAITFYHKHAFSISDTAYNYYKDVDPPNAHILFRPTSTESVPPPATLPQFRKPEYDTPKKQ